jgi:cytochrome c biogenesis protein CcmG/thiol:disulfide interchange protein DsbE
MNAYIKGLIPIVILVVGVVAYFLKNKDRLTYQTQPPQFSILDRMQKEGVPPLELPRVKGPDLKLSELKGKIVIVNFWASWCNPCVQEFPSFIELIKHYKGEVVLVAVSTDEDRSDMEAFLKVFKIPMAGIEVLMDPKRVTADAWGVGKIPESFLIGRDGKLIRKIAGIDNWATPDAFSYFDGLLGQH